MIRRFDESFVFENQILNASYLACYVRLLLYCIFAAFSTPHRWSLHIAEKKKVSKVDSRSKCKILHFKVSKLFAATHYFKEHSSILHSKTKKNAHFVKIHCFQNNCLGEGHFLQKVRYKHEFQKRPFFPPPKAFFWSEFVTELHIFFSWKFVDYSRYMF